MNQNIFDSLGFIGLLIFIIFILCLIIFVERLSYVNKIAIDSAGFVEGIINLLKLNKKIEAITLCEETESPISSIIKTCLLHNVDTKIKIENSISTVASLETNLLSKRLWLLKFLSLFSILLGLMGTFISITNHFDNFIHKKMALDPTTLLSFLTYALNTTILGLFISILTFCAYSYIQFRIKYIIHDMEWSAHKIHEYYNC